MHDMHMCFSTEFNKVKCTDYIFISSAFYNKVLDVFILNQTFHFNKFYYQFSIEENIVIYTCIIKIFNKSLKASFGIVEIL